VTKSIAGRAFVTSAGTRHWTAVVAQPVAFASQQKDRLKKLALEIKKDLVEKNNHLEKLCLLSQSKKENRNKIIEKE
jgi:hypothetical protein